MDHVKNDIVVCRILMVTVNVPLGCKEVDFHIACPDHVIQSDTRIKEIWAGMHIMLPGMQNLQVLSTGGAQRL